MSLTISKLGQYSCKFRMKQTDNAEDIITGIQLQECNHRNAQ